MFFVSSLPSTDIFCCESDPNPCSKSILVLQHQQQPQNIELWRKLRKVTCVRGKCRCWRPTSRCRSASLSPSHSPPSPAPSQLWKPSQYYTEEVTAPSGWTRSRSSPCPPPPPERMHTSWNKCSKMENWFLQSWTLILHWLRSWLAISRVTSYLSSREKRWFKSSNDVNIFQTRFNLAFCGHPLPFKACTLKKHLLARVKNTLTFDKYNFEKYSFEKFTLDLLAWV